MSVVAVIAGCTAGLDDEPAPITHETSAAISCPPLSMWGSFPDDGKDDRDAIQRSMASGCSKLLLDAGTYDLETQNPRPGHAVLTVPPGVELAGRGDATVLRFYGDGKGSDWFGLLMSSFSTVHHLKIDTSALVGTEEHTHAIRLSGPVTSPLIEDVTFHHPIRGLPGGDCIELNGNPGVEVVDPMIRDNRFEACDRSGVAFHSGVHGGHIMNNTFSNTGDQDLDGEGTGDIDGLEIGPGNVLNIGPNVGSAGGLSVQLASNLHVHHNTFNGRGVFSLGCDNCEFDHNTITQTRAGGTPMDVRDSAAHFFVHDETITRAASAGVGAVVRFVPSADGLPSDIHVVNSSLTQEATGNTLDTEGVVGVHLSGNQFHYAGGPGKFFSVSSVGRDASMAHPVPVRTTDITLDGNTATGPFAGVLRVSGNKGGAGTVSMIGNTAIGATGGLVCEAVDLGSRVLGPVTYLNNTMPAPVCGSLVP